MNVLIHRNKHQGKTVDYSSLVGKVCLVFKETKSTYVVHSNEQYSFVTTIPKKDCRITNEPTIKYTWIK